MMIGMAGLMVVVAASLVAPRTAAAANRHFVITTDEEILEDRTLGTFVASGAIEGTGTATQSFGIGMILVSLRSDDGWINFEPAKWWRRQKGPGKFEVTYASGVYAPLLGITVSYSEEVGPSYIHREFHGSVP